VLTAQKTIVVVPMFRATLGPHELRSMESLRAHLLPRHDVTIVTQRSSLPAIEANPLCQGIRTGVFPESFASYQGFNRLMQSLEFFGTFKHYTHMLMFQTDCLAFHGDVSHWVDSGIDYVGAPWVRRDPMRGDLEILGVGNGGLSFRKIQPAIEVLTRFSSLRQRFTVALKFAPATIPALWHKCFIDRFWPRYHIGARNEDVFWSQVAPVIKPGFRVADIDSALSFAFEREPNLCYEACGRRLPLGLHAFHRYAEGFLSQVQAGL